MKIRLLVVALALAVLPLSAHAAKGPDLSTPEAKLSYGTGMELAIQLKSVPFALDVDAFLEGVRAGHEDQEPKYGKDQISQAMQQVMGQHHGASQAKPDAQSAIIASYGLGLNIGVQMKGATMPIDVDLFTLGMREAVAGKKPRVSPEEIRAVSEQVRKQLGETNRKKGEEYLAQNRKKKGVRVTENGIQYRVINKGKGDHPQASSTVSVHYRGTLIDGTEFDSSYSRGEPASFPVNRVIQGWQEILPMMPVGAKWEVTIPSDLAYGETGSPAIGPNETLIFEIELLKIM